METQVERLFTAVKQGDLQAVEAILNENGTLAAARDDSGMSAVITAAYYSQPAVADLLIKRGAPLDVFEASAVGDVDRLRELVETDPAVITNFSPDGFQPLGLAAFFGHLPAVQFLLAEGADPSTTSQNALLVSPLNSAAAGQRVEVAEALLTAGADPDARQSGGFVPLHSAAQNGQVEMIQLLLDFGANPLAKDDNGQTPLDMAEAHGQTAAADALRAAADPAV